MGYDHIHTLEDGRGLRDVFVDGVKIPRATYADEKKGKVVLIVDPIKIHKHGNRVITKTVYGKVSVEFKF